MFTRKFFAAFVAAVSMAMMTSSVYAQTPDLGVQKGPRTDGDLLNSENVFMQNDGSYVRLNLSEGEDGAIDLSDVNMAAAVGNQVRHFNGYQKWLVIRNKQTGQTVRKLIFEKRHTGWQFKIKAGAEYRMNFFGPVVGIGGKYNGVNQVANLIIGTGVARYFDTSTKAGDLYIAPFGELNWQYKVWKKKSGTLEKSSFSIGLYAEASFRRDINRIQEIAPLADGQEARTDAVDGMNGCGGFICTFQTLTNVEQGNNLELGLKLGGARAYKDFGHTNGFAVEFFIAYSFPLSLHHYTDKVGVKWAQKHGKTVRRIVSDQDWYYQQLKAGTLPYQQPTNK